MRPRLFGPAEFLEKIKRHALFDVRSPGEYGKGHIPGAHNLPLFTDEERQEVGTLYRQKGRQAAVLRGLDMVGPRLGGYITEARNIASDRNVLLYCLHGGMRSESLAWLLEKGGCRVGLLEGGYKAYRHHVLRSFENALDLVILGGMTGSGKTDILHILRQKGEQVLDLEGLARHRGSAFGAMQGQPQPSSEQFENDIHAVCSAFSPRRRVWVEDESRLIGRVCINDVLFRRMRQALVFKVEVPRDMRVARLCREYGRESKEHLASAVRHIHKRLGGARVKAVLQAIDDGDYAVAAQALLDYYDKGYQHGNAQRDQDRVFEVRTDCGHPEKLAAKLLALADSLPCAMGPTP
jgi:tRNA 2-selenouridine synthase